MMIWVFLMAFMPFIQYAFYGLKQTLLGHARILLISAVAVGLLFLGTTVYVTSYFDNSPKWVLPVHMQRDAAGIIAIEQNQQNMEQRLAQLPGEIDKLRTTNKNLADHQKVLYNRLFEATVELERDSKISYELINRFGPAANMFLKDFSKTTETLGAIAAYEATLPENAPARVVLDEQRINLMQANKAKEGYFSKIMEYRLKAEPEPVYTPWVAPAPDFNPIQPPPASKPIETPKPVEQQPKVVRPQVQEMEPYEVEEVVPMPNEQSPIPHEYQVEPTPEAPAETVPEEQNIQPISYRSSTSISDEDGDRLWKTHKLMSDIDMVQTQIAKNTNLILYKYNQIDTYQAQLALERQDPSLKVPGAKLPVTYVFVQEKSRGVIQEGSALFSCRVGLLWCSYVGSVKSLHTETVKASHPTSGKLVEGFLAEVQLTDPAANRAEVLHLEQPVF